jgi:Icc-related predicted phosphoesterase
MKIAIASDIHLEFGNLDISNDNHADVLILSGDICVAADLDMRDRRQTELGFARYRSERFHDFFERCAENFPHVIYVMGNHEYYHSDFATALGEMRRKLEHLTNLYIMERDVKVIGNVTFIGGTLWTDMNSRDSLTLYHMRTMMNDFRVIQNSTTPVHFRTLEGEFRTRVAKFSPEDSVTEHVKMKQYIQSVVQGNHDTKYVVVGHHSPSRLSTHEMYKHDTIMNGGYSSDLDEFIKDHPQIRLWTHGHTHHPFDYVIGETRIVCNPRGYVGHEVRADEFTLLTVEI